ncbi:MAG: LytTR family DNA-binding domain-containing protein [Bacteroidota bacterium]
MEILSCILIDDEPLAREGLSDYIQQIDFLNLKGAYPNAIQATQIVKTVDLLFLDIEMPNISGLDFLKILSDPPMVILTTAYPEYALESYQLDVLDYLLKPITFQRLLKAVQKAQDFKTRNKQDVAENYFFIKVENKYEKIVLDELLYVEGMQNYVVVHTTSGKFVTWLTLKSVEERLASERFMRVHRSFLVAKDKVEGMEGNELFVRGSRIPVSRGLKDLVLKEVIEKHLWKR